MHFHSDLRQGFIGGVLHGADKGVVLGTVFQDESGSQPDHAVGFLQGQQVSGFLPVSFASVGMFTARTLGTVLALGVFAHHVATESASNPNRTATTRVIGVGRRRWFEPDFVGVKPLFGIRADRRRLPPGA